LSADAIDEKDRELAHGKSGAGLAQQGKDLVLRSDQAAVDAFDLSFVSRAPR
jgi:hypothetical protein